MIKIKPSIAVELFDNDGRECNQVLHIHPHPENERDWSALSVQDTDPGHFDGDPKPRIKILFDNTNLNVIIKALTLYKQSLDQIASN